MFGLSIDKAFLRSDADCTIFVYPPKGQSDSPGQLLKLAKMLYGSKQAAALWFNLLNAFLEKLGFIASPMDPCFYRRPCEVTPDSDDSSSDAIIILHVDDMCVAAPPDILKVIHDQLYNEFQITTSDCDRFLGMDTEYNLTTGIFKMHMATYIQSTVERLLHTTSSVARNRWTTTIVQFNLNCGNWRKSRHFFSILPIALGF